MYARAVTMFLLLVPMPAAALSPGSGGLGGMEAMDGLDGVREANRAWLLETFDIPMGTGLVGTMSTSDGEVTATVDEAVDEVLARLGEVDVPTLVRTAQDAPQATKAGHIWLLESYWGPVGVANACSTGGGVGGHMAWAEPSEGPLPYIGEATSDVSVHGVGVAFEWLGETGVPVSAWGYASSVHYLGNSDFWCFEATDGVETFVMNVPMLWGTVTSLGPV